MYATKIESQRYIIVIIKEQFIDPWGIRAEMLEVILQIWCGSAHIEDKRLPQYFTCKLYVIQLHLKRFTY